MIERNRLTPTGVAAVVGVPVLLLLLTHLFLAERSGTGGSPWLSLSPDTHWYVKMVRGDFGVSPFSHRRLVPLLASLLPLPPLQALWAITEVSVVAGYAVLLWVLIAVLRVGLGPACLSIAAFMTSTRSLLLVQNPFVIDGFVFFMMTLMLAAFLADKPRRFGLAAVVGVLAREDCLFGAIGFLAARRQLAGAVIAGAALVAYGLPRWLLPGSPQTFVGFGQLAHASYYVKIYFAYGFVWPLTLLGLWLVRSSELRPILPYFACTLLGSLVSTFFALDTTRVFLPVLPVALVGVAVVFDRLWGRRRLMAAWLGVALANLGLALPNTLFPGSGEHFTELEDWYRRLAIPISLHQLAGLVLVALSARLVLATSARAAGAGNAVARE